jgi:hypothetical protein
MYNWEDGSDGIGVWQMLHTRVNMAENRLNTSEQSAERWRLNGATSVDMRTKSLEFDPV